MVFDTLRERMGGDDKITPMGIAHHTLFTAKEKLDLLRQLKADATSKDETTSRLAAASRSPWARRASNPSSSIRSYSGGRNSRGVSCSR